MLAPVMVADFAEVINLVYKDFFKINYCLPQTAKNAKETITTTEANLLRRCVSTAENPSYEILFEGEDNYPYNLDTCQTIFLVEKNKNGRGQDGIDIYEVTILFTREYRLNWIKAKLQVIFQRIVIAEQNIPALNNYLKWAIIGSIDCQPDRNKSQSGFHQDNIVYAFLPDDLIPYLNTFFTDIFPPGELFYPDGPPTQGFSVESPTTAHFGILDYLSLISIIAATGKYHDSGYYSYTVVPPTTENERGYLFYLNSVITHSTPGPINIDKVLDYYTPHPERIVTDGFDTQENLEKILDYYNSLIELSRDPTHKRNFRRTLGKCIFDLEAKQERIDGLKNVFFQRAANKLVNIDLVYNIEENAPRVRNFYTYASQIFSKPQKPVVDIIPVQEQNAAAVLEQNAAAVKQANGDAISGLEWKKIENVLGDKYKDRENKRSQRKTKNKRCKKNRKTKHGQKKKRKTKKR